MFRKYLSMMTPLLDEAGDGAGGGSQAGAGASGQQTQTQTQTGTQTGTQTAQTQQTSSQPTGQTGSPTEYRYKEDRSDWIPRHRLNEASQQAAQLKAQLEDAQRRLNLALGGNGASANPDEEKAKKVTDAFFALPGMAKLRKLVDLDDAQLERLLQVPEHVESVRAESAQRWERHANVQLETVSQRVADAIGADALNEDQQSDLRVSMREWLRKKATSELQAASDRYGVDAVQRDQRRFSETLRRYEDGDAKVFDEFVTRYTKNWVEPARRSSTAKTSNRMRPVPDGTGRQAVTSSVKRPDKFNSLDERLDFAVKLGKERGMSFER